MAEAPRRAAAKGAAKTAKGAAKTARTAAKVAETAASNGNGEVVEDVVHAADSAAATIKGVSVKSGDLGLGFMGAAISLWSAAYAYTKFRQALGKPVVPIPAPPTE